MHGNHSDRYVLGLARRVQRTLLILGACVCG